MACLNECVLYPRLMVVLAVAGSTRKKHTQQQDKGKKSVMLHLHSIRKSLAHSESTLASAPKSVSHFFFRLVLLCIFHVELFVTLFWAQLRFFLLRPKLQSLAENKNIGARKEVKQLQCVCVCVPQWRKLALSLPPAQPLCFCAAPRCH